MNPSGKVLVWVSAALVALPLSPCAFLPSACCQQRTEAKVDVAPPARACCAQHNEPASQPAHSQRQKPYSGDCCLLSPFGPTSDKVVVGALPVGLVAVLPFYDDAGASVTVSPTDAVPQPLSLNILHCRWRC